MDLSQVLDLTQQGTNNVYNWSYPDSPYSQDTPGVNTTLLLGPSMDPRIVKSYNQSFSNTLFFLSLPKIEVNDMNIVWPESPNIESPVQVRANVGAVAAVPPGSVVQVIPITDASASTVGINHKLIYPDGITEGIVTARVTTPGAQTVTVTSPEGGSFPALVTGDVLGNSGERHGDAQPIALGTYRSAILLYSNTVEELGPFAVRWDPKDSVRWNNAGTTLFKTDEYKRQTERYFNAILKTCLVSNGGRTAISNGQGGTRFSLSTKGLMNQMQDNGVGVSSVTAADMIDWMRNTVFDNQLADGTEDWLLIGPGRILDMIGNAEISQRLRYQVGDNLYDTTLTSYKYWGHNITPIRCNAMENTGLFGPGLSNRVILIRKSQLELFGMKGWPMFGMMTKRTLANNQNSEPVTGFGNVDYVEYRANFGIKVTSAWSGGLADVISA